MSDRENVPGPQGHSTVSTIRRARSRRWLARLRAVVRAPFRPERILILGATPLAAAIVEEVATRPGPRRVVIGVADDLPAAGTFLGRPSFGPLSRLDRIVDATRPDRIVVALEERRGKLPLRALLSARVRGIRVESAEEFYERISGAVPVEALTPAAILFSSRFATSSRTLAAARFYSLALAVIALALLAPVLVVIAVAIRLESRGPVLFVQERVGLNGRRFRMIKFRTMRPTPGRASVWERDNLHRITMLGRWLRRHRLDEIPQLWNVIRGEMNLVGPRPHPSTHYEVLTAVMRNAPERGAPIPLYSIRTLVRPGMTGWAQIRYGYANDLREELDKLRFDLFYVKHLSLALDLRILLKTLGGAVLGFRPDPRRREPSGALEADGSPARLLVPEPP